MGDSEDIAATDRLVSWLETGLSSKDAPATIGDIATIYSILALQFDIMLKVHSELRKAPIAGPRDDLDAILTAMESQLERLHQGMNSLASRGGAR